MNAVATPNPATDAAAQQIRAQQVRLLYEQAPLGIAASLLIASMLVLVVWNALPRLVLILWLLAVVATLLARLVLAVTFLRCPDASVTAERWAARHTWASAATGVCWGGCIVLLALSPSLVYDAFIALMLGGVLMGGVFTMSPILHAYVAYALPLGLPPMLWLLLRDDPMHMAMGAAGVFYLLLALATAQRFHRTLARSLRLAAENLSLAQSFASAKEQAEETNRQLAGQQAALRDSVAAMRELYQVISTPHRHASDRIQALLAMGCQRFGMAIGLLCHMDGERQEVVQSITPNGEIAPGDVLNLADAYCRDTLRVGTLLGFEHASVGPWREHPCYQKFGLEAYLGVPVQVGDQVYGTLSFSSFTPRSAPFTAVDRELIQLMAQWVGGVLEQERMAEAAQRQQTLLAHASRLNTLGEMASGLVHEINQPITAINLYAEAGLTRARNDALGSVEARETLEKITAQTARVHAIIQRIRDFARQSKPRYTTLRIHDIFADITHFLSLEARRHQIHLRYDIAPELPPVRADALQVQQVLLNLIRNAMDAMDASVGPENRTLVVSARAEAAGVEIAVQDSGPGLAAEVLEQILHPFFTTKPDGLGLGLSISQSIIEAHGGRLWATPNAKRGVTFHFTLPIASAAAAPERATEALSLDAA